MYICEMQEKKGMLGVHGLQKKAAYTFLIPKRGVGGRGKAVKLSA